MAESAQVTTEQPELRSMLGQVCDGAILMALPALYLAGLATLLAADRYPTLSLGVLCGLSACVLGAAVWLLRRLSRVAAIWMLVVGSALVVLQLVSWGRVDAATHLLAIPSGLAALTAGLAGGLATAAVCTGLLLIAPPPLLPPDPALRLVTIASMWSIVGMVWLTLRPLLSALEWSWASQERSRALLEQARDSQMHLKQTLADLADANTQLTRLNRLAQGLRQAAEEARRAKERFAANVSHELRTPLNMVIGFSEMILHSPESYGKALPQALLADLEVILQNSRHLWSLIEDVLDLSQIEAGRVALTRERVVLANILQAAVVAVRPLYGAKGLYLESEVDPDLEVYCDPTRIREVVLNLLSNAGRFTASGGARLRAWRDGDSAVVGVADTGPGIDREDQGRLFQPFEQLDGSLRRRHEGSGLGLSISKSFVELHGGRMWLQSEKGAGTTFYFSLPIDPPAPAEGDIVRWFNPHWHYEERTRRTLAPEPVVRPRFVVLEAGHALQRLLTRYLDNVEVVSAAALDEAMGELARTPASALLINDISPGEMLETLARGGALPYGTPAIVCSLPGTHDAAGSLGVSDYLVKPVNAESLLAAVDRLPLDVRTILIADDEPDVLRLFWRMLASAQRGYRVLTASNGQQALSMLGKERPDLLLLDLVMPGMDGFQLLAVKGGDPALRDIPVIVVSARDPAGQPIVTSALAVTRGGGLSAPQLLGAIEGLTGILASPGQDARPVPRSAPSGSQA